MIIYPLYSRPPSLIEKIARRSRATLAFCNVCGKWSVIAPWTDNYRESGNCRRCGAYNRQRQIAHVLCTVVSKKLRKAIGSLKEMPNSDIAIYNTETSRAVHEQLSSLPNYICSEYFGPQYAPGEIVNGVRHEDLQQLSFESNSLDIMLSSDVFEHVPDPYLAFREVHRVLKPGGRHIFTVPFHQTEFRDDVRAVIEHGEIRLLKEPIYHLDPLRPEGILVYTIFALEMLVKLDEIGFRTYMHLLYQPRLGILGNNALCSRRSRHD